MPLEIALGVAGRITYAMSDDHLNSASDSTPFGFRVESASVALSAATNGVATAAIAYKAW
jgi:hypothetical protein